MKNNILEMIRKLREELDFALDSSHNGWMDVEILEEMEILDAILHEAMDRIMQKHGWTWP